MKKHRPTLIWTGLLIAGGIASAAVWIEVTGTFRPAWWWICIGSVLIGVAADAGEKAITRELERPRRPGPRRRAHARPAASTPLARSANRTDTRKDTHPV